MLSTLARSVFHGAERVQPKVLSSADLGSLIYSRLVPPEQDYFARRGQQHNRVELRDLPHYGFWRDREEASPSEGAYDAYLRCTEPDAARRREAIASYVALRNAIRAEGIKEPLRVLIAPDGRRVLLDGARRASIAYVLGLDARCVHVSLHDELADIVANREEFYGTKNAGRPYQSIFYKETELVPGRRVDIIERFRKMDIAADIRGRSVLDIGCNIAVNAMTAWHFGARTVTGMEFSPRIAASALRLSTILDARIRMMVQDLGSPITSGERFDTVLCFSLYNHVPDKAVLERNIASLTGSVLYFEGHENSARDDYEPVFRHFARIEPLGFNRDGIHSKAATRPFFRCSR